MTWTPGQIFTHSRYIIPNENQREWTGHNQDFQHTLESIHAKSNWWIIMLIYFNYNSLAVCCGDRVRCTISSGIKFVRCALAMCCGLVLGYHHIDIEHMEISAGCLILTAWQHS